MKIARYSARDGIHWGIVDLDRDVIQPLNGGYADSRTRLACGDVLFTGTPGGVALESGRFLTEGNTVEATIDSVGILVNTVGTTRNKRP
jgi:hypothetical protein